MKRIVRLALPVAVLSAGLPSLAKTVYVAPDGKDAWSGALPAANAAKSDGPLASLGKARDALRGATGEKKIILRGGTHFLRAPLELLPQDSGLQIEAFPAEKPVLSGGRAISGWKQAGGKLWMATIPDAPANWFFRDLRAGEQKQILARTPNFDANNPYLGGWNFVVENGPKTGVFGAGVGKIHTSGDFFEWKINASQSGEYAVWFYYAADNKPFGNASMAGRTSLQVDGGQAVVLQGLEDTGSWGTKAWSRTGTLNLDAGEHTLRWTNITGGGLNFDAFVLSDDLDWKPPASPKSDEKMVAAAGKSVIVVQAEAFTKMSSKEGVVDESSAAAYRDRFGFKPNDIPAFALNRDAEIRIFPAWGWVSTILQVKNVDRRNRVVHVEQNKNASEELRVGNRYYLSNVREALDAPGEWFYDRTAKVLWWWPASPDLHSVRVVAPVLDRLIEFKGDAANRWVENVSIKGLQFSDTTYARELRQGVYAPDDAAIWMSGARKCVIEGNRFVNLGGYALRLADRSTGVEFVGNEVGHVGQGGVMLSGDVASQPRDTLIAGNWMHHLGEVYKHVAGVYCITASGTRIAHNRFEDLPRYAISFKGLSDTNYSHNNVAEYNEILRTNLETNDTGAIETLGREKQETGNVIQYNRILDVVGVKAMPDGSLRSPYFTWGIYLDDYSSGTTVRGNIVARHDWGGGCIHGGRNNLFENNIFIDGMSHQMRYQVRDEFCKNNRFVRNIIVYKNPDANVFMHTGTWRPNVLSESNFNVLWHAQGSKYFEGRNLTPLGTWAQWRAGGYDVDSIIADPLFVDAGKDDYRLQTDSPALTKGFKPIPVEKIGLRGYSRAWKIEAK